MAFEFDKLPPEAKKAAFANMDAKRKAAGAGKSRGGLGRLDLQKAGDTLRNVNKGRTVRAVSLGTGARHQRLTRSGSKSRQSGVTGRLSLQDDAATLRRINNNAAQSKLGSGSRREKITKTKAKLAQVDQALRDVDSVEADLKAGRITPAQARDRLQATRAASGKSLGSGDRHKDLSSGKANQGESQTPKTESPKLSRTETVVMNELQGLERKPGDWVLLADLRDRLSDSGMSPAGQEKLLRQMSRDRKLFLVPDSNRKAHTDRDRAAAIRIGGEDTHMVARQIDS